MIGVQLNQVFKKKKKKQIKMLVKVSDKGNEKKCHKFSRNNFIQFKMLKRFKMKLILITCFQRQLTIN